MVHGALPDVAAVATLQGRIWELNKIQLWKSIRKHRLQILKAKPPSQNCRISGLVIYVKLQRFFVPQAPVNGEMQKYVLGALQAHIL